MDCSLNLPSDAVGGLPTRYTRSKIELYYPVSLDLGSSPRAVGREVLQCYETETIVSNEVRLEALA